MIINLKNFLSYLLRPFRPTTSKSTIVGTDSGIFDPFVPLGSLKKIDKEYQTAYEPGELQQYPTSEIEVRPSFVLSRILAVVIAAIFCTRLISLQITRGQENYLLAEGNRLKTTLVPAPRGLIYDRNGVALVQNIPSFSLVLRLSDYPVKKDARAEFVSILSERASIPKDVLQSKIDSQLGSVEVVLVEGLTREESMKLELRTHDIQGIQIEKSPVREYQPIVSLGNLIGYIGKVTSDDLDSRPDLLPVSYIGKSGVERSYDEILQGQPAHETLEVDSLGRTIRSLEGRSSTPGQSLILGLDSALQTVTAEALQSSIDKSGAKNGAAVAMDVNTGEILAMVSLPTFDNNIFSPLTDSAIRKSALEDPASPLINRAIAGQYPSGSTIKPFVASAGLESKIISDSTKIDTSEGQITVGQWVFPDWKTHGLSDVKQAIAESNNIFFYALGGGYKQITGLGAERLASSLTKFGFGQYTGIDIPGEKLGLVPTPDWKKKAKKESWYIGDTYNLAIGQGDLLITPLQLARATAVVANGGKLIKPRLVRSSFSFNQGQKDYPVLIEDESVVDDQFLAPVREGMRRAVLSGSARSFAILPVEVAAKTGTAQFDKAKEKTHSWFTAFAPYNNPQIAISVIVEGGGEGFAVAAPVAKNIVEQYFKLPLTPIQPAEEPGE